MTSSEIAKWIFQFNLPDVKNIDVKSNSAGSIDVLLKNHDGSAVSLSSIAVVQQMLMMMLPPWINSVVTTPTPVAHSHTVERFGRGTRTT